MSGLKRVIARFKLKMMAKKSEPTLLTFPADMKKSYCVLVCLPPGQRELTMVKQLLPDLSRVFSEAEIYLMASPGHNVYDIFPRKGFRIMSPSADHVSWSGIASKKYLDLLREKKFDVIFDLNLNPNSFMQSILLAMPDAIRIGKGNSIGTPFYNVEIITKFIRDEKNIYKSMIETIDSIKNSGSNTINGAIN